MMKEKSKSKRDIIKEELRERARRELAKRNFREYLSYIHEGRYEHAKHTDYITQIIQEMLDDEPGAPDKLIISMPPRHGKSMMITESLPSYVFLRNPDTRVMLAAYGQTLATDFVKRNAEKVDLFGETFDGEPLNYDMKQANLITLKGYRGMIMGGGITTGFTGKGADLLIVDDPYKGYEDSHSKTQRENIWNEYINSLQTRLSKDGKIILIQTRWHDDDLAARLEEMDGWTSIRLPALADSPDDPLGRKIGEPLWPEFFDKEKLDEIRRAQGQASWQALYQQNPTPEGGTIFRKELLNFYKREDLYKKDLVYFQSWDLTFKGKDTGDYVAGQVWAVDKDSGNMYLIDHIRGRFSFIETLQAIRNMKAKHPQTVRILIEDAANGPAVIDTLRNEMTGIFPVRPRGSKEERAHAATPYVEAGDVKFLTPEEDPDIEDLLYELTAFPGGRHDDQVDALTQAVNFVYTSDEERGSSGIILM